MPSMTARQATLNCPSCGKPFAPIRRAQRFCSKACNHDHARRTAKKRQNLPPPAASRTCPECGARFAPRHPDQDYCSTACQQAVAVRWRAVGPRSRQALLDRVDKRRPGETTADVRRRKGRALTILGRLARDAARREAEERAAKRGDGR